MGRYFRTCERCGAHLDPSEICDCENMTPAQKAVETRRKHKESQKEKKAGERMIRKKMTVVCLQALYDPSASVSDKMRAVEILHEISEKGWR